MRRAARSLMVTAVLMVFASAVLLIRFAPARFHAGPIRADLASYPIHLVYRTRHS
jgi:hypothetical protein